MAEPSLLPVWDTNETNTTEPDATHKADGFTVTLGVPEKPKHQHFNFWMNNAYKWIVHFKATLAGYGTSVTKDVGTAAGQIPLNSNLGSAAQASVGTGTTQLTTNSRVGDLIAAFRNTLAAGAFTAVGTVSASLTTNSRVNSLITTFSTTLKSGAFTTVGSAATKNVGNSTGQVPIAGVGTGSTQLTTNSRVSALIAALKLTLKTGAFTTVGSAATYTVGTAVGNLWTGTTINSKIAAGKINGVVYTKTSVSVVLGTTPFTAPSGYRYLSHDPHGVVGQGYPPAIWVASINTTGTSISLSSTATATVDIVWVKNT